MERFERDLPLTTKHVARLLDISERTVKRTIPVVARSKPGGTVWYSRAEVEALWQVRADGDGGKRDTGSPRRQGGRSRSSIAASAVGSSTSSLPTSSEPASHSVDAVEKRLRGAASITSSDSSGGRLLPIRPRSPGSPPK
jgi:hypothetical protein